jgi:hypothetical protein
MERILGQAGWNGVGGGWLRRAGGLEVPLRGSEKRRAGVRRAGRRRPVKKQQSSCGTYELRDQLRDAVELGGKECGGFGCWRRRKRSNKDRATEGKRMLDEAEGYLRVESYGGRQREPGRYWRATQSSSQAGQGSSRILVG